MSAKTTKTAEINHGEAVTEETIAAHTSATKAKQKGNVVYLGPTISGVIKHSTVFLDGILPEKVQECVSNFPMMRRLFVSTGEMAAAVREISKQQSALGAIYAQTAQKFSGR